MTQYVDVVIGAIHLHGFIGVKTYITIWDYNADTGEFLDFTAPSARAAWQHVYRVMREMM